MFYEVESATVDNTMVANDVMCIRIPKRVATISICGALSFEITDVMSFTKPTPEQIKNLHDMFCIDVIIHDKEDSI
jgi:hypothetical protein